MFTISEQATSIISGIDFAFDEKGKAEVIKAAIPVINKHGSQLLGLFGNYIEEATLLLAVLALIYTSKRHVTQLKVLKAQQEAANGEKAKPPLKLPNPVNSNPSLDAEHIIYVAGTGGGKTSAVKHMGFVPKGSQAVFFDPTETMPGKSFKASSATAQALALPF